MKNDENNTQNIISVISEETIRDKIYFIRGQKIMLDYDLAEIYGYTTRAFNQQVKNNLDKFDVDFRFQLSKLELPLSLKSKFSISNTKGNKRGLNIKKLPYAFTEQGIYMLMTVLKGELATRQSKTLIRLFKQMKDYFLEKPIAFDNSSYEQIIKNKNDISFIKSTMATKDDLVNLMKGFIEYDTEKEYLFLNGQLSEAKVTYKNIFSLAKASIILIDNYISLQTLLLFRELSTKIKITIFSDNIGNHLTKDDYGAFLKEYPNFKIRFIRTEGKVHDRFIVLDYKTKNQTIYHCGCSAKDGGGKTSAIIRTFDNELYIKMLEDLHNNKELII